MMWIHLIFKRFMYYVHSVLPARRHWIIIDGCKLPCGCWASNSGPLEEHAAFCRAPSHTPIMKLTGTAVFVSFKQDIQLSLNFTVSSLIYCRAGNGSQGRSILGNSSRTKQHPRLSICQLVRGILK